MQKHLNGLIGAALISAVLAVGTMATASAATAHAGHQSASRTSAVAHHVRHPSYTLQVKGVAWPSNGLNIRSGPGTFYPVIGTMPHNGTGTAFCYSNSTTPIHGDPYWDDVMSAWGQGFVADYYFFTGGNIYDQIDGC